MEASYALGRKNAKKSLAASDHHRDDYDTYCAGAKDNPSWTINKTRHGLEGPMGLSDPRLEYQQRGLPPTSCHSWFARP